MDCKYAEKLMMKYMDGCLTEKEKEDLNCHILICEKCKEDFLVYDAMMKEARMLSSEEITAPKGFEEAVMFRIRNEKAAEYGYKKTDKIKIACVGICAIMCALSYFVYANQQAVIIRLYQYPVFKPYLDRIIPFARSVSELCIKTMDLVNVVFTRADEILSSMGIAIIGLIVVCCALQGVVSVRNNRRR